MSIKKIVIEREVSVCDLCGRQFQNSDSYSTSFLLTSEQEGDGGHRYFADQFDFCENCQILLTDNIISGALKKFLIG